MILKARRGNENYLGRDQLRFSGQPTRSRQHDLIRRLSRCRAQHTLRHSGIIDTAADRYRRAVYE